MSYFSQKKKRHERSADAFEDWLNKVGVDFSSKGHGSSSRYFEIELPDEWRNVPVLGLYLSTRVITIRFADHGQPRGGGYSLERGERWGDADLSIDPTTKATPQTARQMVKKALQKFGLWKKGKAVPYEEWEEAATGRPREANSRVAKKETLFVPNPACGGTKPVHLITDRAKRYRANHPDCRPPGPRRCHLCGSRKNVDVHHLDGNEDHGAPENLIFACRACNAAIGAAYAKKGIGKRTRQFNGQKRGARRVPSFAEYVAAVVSHRRGAWDAGGKVIHATPVDVRAQYAQRIWELRRQRGTDSQIPF